MKLVIVDDHPLLAVGLKRELESRGVTTDVVVPRPSGSAPSGATSYGDRLHAGRSCLDAAEDGPSSADREPVAVMERILALEPDLVLVDLDMPICGGGAALVEAMAPDTTVAILTGVDDPRLWSHCLESGARVVLSKSEPLERLLNQIMATLHDRPVKPQQRQQLRIDSHNRHRTERERKSPFARLSVREADVLSGLMDGLNATEIADRDCVSVQTVRTQIKSVLHKLEVRSQLAAVARAHAAGWRKPAHSQRRVLEPA